MGHLLNYYQATQAVKKTDVDQTEHHKEKAVEEAASLERDIDTLANTLGKTCTVNLLGPILHVSDVTNDTLEELKIEVAFDGSGFNYLVESADQHSTSYLADKFNVFMIDWLKRTR